MKEVLKKVFSLEPMSAQERESVALGACVSVFAWFLLGLAVLFA